MIAARICQMYNICSEYTLQTRWPLDRFIIEYFDIAASLVHFIYHYSLMCYGDAMNQSYLIVIGTIYCI